MTQEIKCLSSDLKICGSILFHRGTSGHPRVPQIAKWMSRWHIVSYTFYKPVYANVKVTVCASWGPRDFEKLRMPPEAGSDGGLSYVIIWKSTSHSPALSCLFLALPFQFSTKSLQSLCELVPQLSCQTLLISSSNPAQPCICVKWFSFCTLINPLLWESVAAPRLPSPLGCVGALLFPGSAAMPPVFVLFCLLRKTFILQRSKLFELACSNTSVSILKCGTPIVRCVVFNVGSVAPNCALPFCSYQKWYFNCHFLFVFCYFC